VVSGVPALAMANVGIESDHVRVGSLFATADMELDEVAQEVEVLPADQIEDEEVYDGQEE
jgi:hypothetical protein